MEEFLKHYVQWKKPDTGTDAYRMTRRHLWDNLWWNLWKIIVPVSKGGIEWRKKLGKFPE